MYSKKKRSFSINSKNFKKYIWKKSFRGGTIKDRLALYNEKSRQFYTPSSLRQKKEIATRIGSDSRHGEVYRTQDNCALKIAPQSNASNCERQYLELFTQSVIREECEHFPLLYAENCFDGVVFQNDQLAFEAFDNVADRNIEICLNYIEKHIDLIDDDQIKKKIHSRLNQSQTTCDSKQSDVQLAWKLFKRYRDPTIELPRPQGLVVNMFLVELANGDLNSFLKKKGILSTLETKSILFGIFYGLYIMDTVYGVVHGDLHTGNVLVSQIPESSKKYLVLGREYTIDHVIYLPILWDFETVRNKRYPEETLRYDVDKILESMSYLDIPGVKSMASKRYKSWTDVFDDVRSLK